jgi:hypothetical protein
VIILIFIDVMPCSLVDVYRHFRGMDFLCCEGLLPCSFMSLFYLEGEAAHSLKHQ